MSIGRVFHNEAAAVSIRRLPYFTVLFLLQSLEAGRCGRAWL